MSGLAIRSSVAQSPSPQASGQIQQLPPGQSPLNRNLLRRAIASGSHAEVSSSASTAVPLRDVERTSVSPVTHSGSVPVTTNSRIAQSRTAQSGLTNDELRRLTGGHSGSAYPVPVSAVSYSTGSTDPQFSANAAVPVAPAEQTQPFLDLTGNDTGVTGGSPGYSAGDSQEGFLRVAIGFVVVLCGLILAVMYARSWQRSRGLLPVNNNNRSRVLETLGLGPGRTVSLIEMDGVRAFVGADSGGIRTIVLLPRTFDEEIHGAVTTETEESDQHRDHRRDAA